MAKIHSLLCVSVSARTPPLWRRRGCMWCFLHMYTPRGVGKKTLRKDILFFHDKDSLGWFLWGFCGGTRGWCSWLFAMPYSPISALWGSFAVEMILKSWLLHILWWCMCFYDVPGMSGSLFGKNSIPRCVSWCRHAPPLFGDGGVVCDVSCTHALREGWEWRLSEDTSFFPTTGVPLAGFCGVFSDVLDAGVVGLLLCHVLL